jgi:hypothetical protein
MKKMLQAVAVSAALMLAVAGASAATTVNLTNVGTHYTGGFTVTHSAAFSDEFNFSPVLPSSWVSASLITIGFSATEDIDFTSVWLNGTPLTLTTIDGADVAYTPVQLLLSGPLTLTVSGISGSNASYSGTINLTVVPEPETYALMAAGLGLVGFVSRRKRKNGQAS